MKIFALKCPVDALTANTSHASIKIPHINGNASKIKPSQWWQPQDKHGILLAFIWDPGSEKPGRHQEVSFAVKECVITYSHSHVGHCARAKHNVITGKTGTW